VLGGVPVDAEEGLELDLPRRDDRGVAGDRRAARATGAPAKASARERA
jgi:hypothetical protein